MVKWYKFIDGEQRLLKEFKTVEEAAAYWKSLPDPDNPPPEKPDSACWNCECFDGDHCTKNWNNMDDSYYNPDTDDKDPFDVCEDHNWNGQYEYED